MNCKQCLYYWQEEGESFPRCHYESIGEFDPAPCECEDEYNERQYEADIAAMYEEE